MRKLFKTKKRLLGALLLSAAVLLTAAFYNGLTAAEYTLRSEKIDRAVTIVLLTDLHSGEFGKNQQKLIEKIDAQKPGLVLMSGDIADDIAPDAQLLPLLEHLSGRYPCYYVTGNHEFWSGRVDAQKALFRRYGITVLAGSCAQVTVNGQTLSIGGVDDPESGEAEFSAQLAQAAAAVRPEQYAVLLAHRPERLDAYAAAGFDLVLSGHAHGGQWRIPFLLPQGVFAPNQGLFPKHTTGIREKDGTKLLVSRGLAQKTTIVPRIFNPPELVVVRLEAS